MDALTDARTAETFNHDDAPPRDASGRVFADLPPEAPLRMPRQTLYGAPPTPERRGKLRSAPEGMGQRRTALIGLTGLMTVAALIVVGSAVPPHESWILISAFLLVFAGLFAWIAFAFLTCMAGLWRMFSGEDARLGLTPEGPLPHLSTRTALLAPIYNENPDEVFRRLAAVDSSLAACGASRHFHIFVLSDSTDATVQAQEYAAFKSLRRRVDNGDRRIFYRHRAENLDKKAGNIGEWVRRFGGAYEHMITLDADSLMTGETLVRLAAAMERRGDIGLIQTVPQLIGRSSLFGRVEQFAHRLYGPLLAHGAAWWMGAEGNYYGHNAIIRTRAFADHAGLPALPGRRPFGGSILSHDFVEAALLRRGGWAVHLAPSLGGSYEECPPTLSDALDRDRRWCQGNVQHLGVLGAHGLNWVSRLHLLRGVSAYLTAPLWLAFMLLGLALQSGAPIEEGGTGGGKLGIVYGACLSLLFVPKLIAFWLAMRDPIQRRGFGGPQGALWGIAVESVMSALLAPILMWSQSRAMFDILTGRDSGWKSQQRGEHDVALKDAAKRYRSHTILGFVLAVSAIACAPHGLSGPNLAPLAWMAPVILGLILAAPIASLTASAELGEWLRRLSILSIPEETQPTRVILQANGLRAVEMDAPEWGRDLTPQSAAEGPARDAAEAA